MKFTSIVIAALVAATQFSSTFADAPACVADTTSTLDGRAVVINVLLNDINKDAMDPPGDTPFVVGQAITGSSREVERINPATLKLDLAMVATPAQTSITGTDFTATLSGTDGGVLISPKPGFVGSFIFFYQVSDADNSGGVATSNVVGVTVTVGKIDPLSFLIPDQISTKDAVGTVRGSLFIAASFSPSSPNTASLTTLLKPVTDVDNFTANTSPFETSKSFSTIFTDFFSLFRGGN
jgi:hypothetical protein